MVVEEVVEAYRYTSDVITGSRPGDVTQFACLERALVSRDACRARMPGCEHVAPPTNLQRGLRSSFPNHIIGEPMASIEMFGRFRWL